MIHLISLTQLRVSFMFKVLKFSVSCYLVFIKIIASSRPYTNEMWYKLGRLSEI